MTIFICRHRKVEDHSAEAAAEAHNEANHGMKYHRYWYYENPSTLLRFTEVPSKEAAGAVYGEEPGLSADEIIEVHSRVLRRKGWSLQPRSSLCALLPFSLREEPFSAAGCVEETPS